jgi:hypothetical protein
MTVERLDLIGALTAYIIFLASILVFGLRLAGQQQIGGPAGAPILVMVLPLGYLLVRAPSADRSRLYYVQISLMILWIGILFAVDYYPGYDFRGRPPLVIGFVVLYFAALGGMIGIASLAGRGWMIGAVVLFFLTLTLAFWSRWATGI